METLEPTLSKHPQFKGMSPEHLKLIVGCAKHVRFKEGEMIFREGEAANVFFVIRHGGVALSVHSPTQGSVTVVTLNDGDALGWSWLMPPFKWHFDAKATQNTIAIALDGKCLREKCEKDSELRASLYERFMPVMADRLEATVMQLLDLYAAQNSEGPITWRS
jgi:CRP-like cAMP-binding protein